MGTILSLSILHAQTPYDDFNDNTFSSDKCEQPFGNEGVTDGIDLSERHLRLEFTADGTTSAEENAQLTQTAKNSVKRSESCFFQFRTSVDFGVFS